MNNKKNENKDQLNKGWYRFGIFLGGMIGMPKVFMEGIRLIREEHKESKEREKAYKGLQQMKKLMDEMDASGKYSDETMDNIHRWWAHACVEYGKMF